MRWLKSAVIGMGVLIMIGFTVVIVTVIQRSNAPPEPVMASDRPTPPIVGVPPVRAAAGTETGNGTFGETLIALPPGAEPEETLLEGDRLIVRLRLPDGDIALLLIDARTGKRLGLVHLERRMAP